MRLSPLRVGLTAAPAPPVVPVPARLRPTESADRPVLWLIREPGVNLLYDFVGSASGWIVNDLDFAVSADGRVAVRARRRRGGPPVLSLPAVACVPLLRLPDVYLPVGTRLRPPVRRDALRDWLCRPGRVTWLYPADAGRFQVESVAADAFRPLSEWVDYAVPAGIRRTLWVPDTRFFALNPFASIDGEPRAVRRGKRERRPGDAPVTAAAGDLPAIKKGAAPPKVADDLAPEESPELDLVPGSEVVARLREAERQFLEADGPLDAPRRLGLWPRLANLSVAAGEAEDAALCWANALWAGDTPPLARRWWQVERGSLPNLDAVVQAPEPPVAQLRALVAWAADAATHHSVPADVAVRLPEAGRVLEEHDYRLPVRIAWLGWLALTRLSGGDVLALTRARDRLLRDLLEHGLRRDRDLPAFLRGGNVRDPVASMDGARILRLREDAWHWCATDRADKIQRVYLDLTFAYALARFGDEGAARAIVDDVGRPDDPATGRRKHRPNGGTLDSYERWLWEAYRERVRRQLAGESATDPLSADSRRGLDALVGEQRSKAERFLKVSRILDPFNRVDPYRQQRPHDPLQEALAELAAYTVPRRKRESAAEQLELRFRALLKERPADKLRILQVAVPLSVRIGESFALECVAKVGPALKRAGRWRDARDLIDRVELLESAVGVAAHFGRQPLIGGLLESLHTLLKDVKGEVAGWAAAALGGSSFRFLSRLGLVDAARSLLDRLTDAVTDGKSVPDLLRTPALNRGVVYPALLRLAGGWFYFGQEELARQAMAAVRTELFEGSMSPDPRAELAAAYAAALGHAPAAEAMAGYAELFGRLRVTSYHAVLHRVKIVEAVALATAAEEFAADARSRQWLDEDEYLVRRRIHADVERAVRGAGLG